MKHVAFRILAGLVLLAALAGIGFFAYSAGIAHGAALDIKQTIIQAEGQPQIPVYGHGMAHRMAFHHTMPFFGFGCFGLLVPLFLFFLAFAAMRHLFWGWGPGFGWRHHMHMHQRGPWGEKGPWGEGVPPFFAEWHRQAHGEPPAPPTEDGTEKK
jgi:hypothetical protein